MTALPPVITRYWYAIDWDVEALWRLDLPVETVSVADLAWHLKVPVWPDATGRPYRVSPRAVLADRVGNAGEFARVQAADLTWPLEVFHLRGRLMILDGIHRLTKAVLEGRTSMAVRRVPDGAVRKL